MPPPYLVLNHGGKALSCFPTENDISCGYAIYGFYYIEVYSLKTYFVEGFYQEWMLYFVKCFFCIYSEVLMVLILSFINVVYHVN